MAFIKLEDRYGEIEVIVFPKQFKRVGSLITEDSAVYAEGTLSVEDDDVRMILSDLKPLQSNESYNKPNEKVQKTVEYKAPVVYIKVSSLTDSRLSSISRLSLLYPGKSSIVIF